MYTSGEYLRKNPTWGSEDSAWKAARILEITERNGLVPESVCEIGCGAGEILDQLHLKMPQAVSFSGYEISPQAFALCQAKEKSRLRFFLKDLPDQGGPAFDLVLLIDVFEHVEDYLGFLRKVRPLGKNTLFHIPLDLSAQAVMREKPILHAREQVGHLHYFTKSTALATLRDAGYEIVDYVYTQRSTDLPAKTLGSFLAKLPRKLGFVLARDLSVRTFGGYSLLVLARDAVKT